MYVLQVVCQHRQARGMAVGSLRAAGRGSEYAVVRKLSLANLSAPSRLAATTKSLPTGTEMNEDWKSCCYCDVRGGHGRGVRRPSSGGVVVRVWGLGRERARFRLPDSGNTVGETGVAAEPANG